MAGCKMLQGLSCKAYLAQAYLVQLDGAFATLAHSLFLLWGNYLVESFVDSVYVNDRGL